MDHAATTHVKAGTALAAAGLIAIAGGTAPVPPAAAPGPGTTAVAVELTASPWEDLFTHTTANLTNIFSNADWSAISQVIGQVFTNPFGVLSAFTDLTPTISTDLSELPATIGVQLPPGLELGLASLGAYGATANAIHSVAQDLAAGDSSAWINGAATVLDAYLNGADNISLLGGVINIPVFNGVLAPVQSFDVDLNLTKLLGLLGLDNLNLGGLGINLDGLLGDLTSGNLNLVDLLNDLGLGDEGLGSLLDNPTLNELLSDLGLDNLGLGSLSLTGILSGLGLDGNVDLNSLSLDHLLSIFGLDPTADVGLGAFLQDVGLGGFLDTSLGSLLGGLPGGLLQSVLDVLNNTVGSLLTNLVGSIPLLGGILNQVIDGVLLTPQDLIDALNNVTVGDLLGGQTLSATLTDILGALGIGDATGSGLTVGGILSDLGFSSDTGALTLNGLLSSLGLGGDPIGSLLNGLDLDGLLNMLGLGNLPIDVGDLLDNLGNLDLSDLSVGELFDALGLNNLDLADISVNSFGGEITQLLDTIPQQILDILGA